MAQGVDTDRIKIDDHSWRIQCAQCDTWFEATRSDASYCSQGCRKRAHQAPVRKQNALHRLKFMVTDAREIKNEWKGSQDVYDQMLILSKALDNILNDFEIEWKPLPLPIDAVSHNTTS